MMTATTEIKERPILFSAPMVRAILDGRKTQTRRVVTKAGHPSRTEFLRAAKDGDGFIFRDLLGCGDYRLRCPYGQPGDRLWVRETWRIGAWDEDDGTMCIDFRADGFCDKTWREVPDPDWFHDTWIALSDELAAKGIEPDSEGNYRWEPGQSPLRWRSSRFMPRWASRITLEVVDVRVERLQDISEADAMAEGYPFYKDSQLGPVGDFEWVWDQINFKTHPWASNPWVWVVEFRRII